MMKLNIIPKVCQLKDNESKNKMEKEKSTITKQISLASLGIEM